MLRWSIFDDGPRCRRLCLVSYDDDAAADDEDDYDGEYDGTDDNGGDDDKDKDDDAEYDDDDDDDDFRFYPSINTPHTHVNISTNVIFLISCVNLVWK